MNRILQIADNAEFARNRIPSLVMPKGREGAVIHRYAAVAKIADCLLIGLAAFTFFAGSSGIRAAVADEAPGAPGIASAWTTGAKDGLGTSTTLQSKIWYTIQQGIFGEVYYPSVDAPNVQDLQYVVTRNNNVVDLERDVTIHDTILVDHKSLTYQQVNTKPDLYRITKTYVTDVARPTLLIETRFEALSGGPYQLYVLYNPSLRNSGMGDTAATSGDALVANDGDVASALVSSSGFIRKSNGYSGTPSDGYQDLQTHGNLNSQFESASAPGNIVQIGQVDVGNDSTFTLALSFGSSRSEAVANAKASLAVSFAEQRARYEDGWHSYVAALTIPKSVAAPDNLRTQYLVALMALKAFEDKTFRGANVASPTIPWGNFVNADECCVPGYHHIWARDLYQMATALLAAGDVDAANRSLDYLLDKQQIKAPTTDGGGLDPGAFPRFSKPAGTDLGCCEQLDQDAFPLVLAWQLNRTDAGTWEKLKLSADHIIAKGPATPKERWEEQDGFSPSTIAAEIAGLVCAADIAQKNSDSGRAESYLAKADEWQKKVEDWTFTTTGTFGNHRYYERHRP
jgi:glucoamylase